MINLLVSILIFLLIASLFWWIVTLLPLPDPIKQIALVVLAIIAVLYLIGALTGQVPLMRLHL